MARLIFNDKKILLSAVGCLGALASQVTEDGMGRRMIMALTA